MSLTEQLNSLWDEFDKKEIHKQNNSIFIKDGIINEEYWIRAKRKILFFYKEAYSTLKGYTDIREIILGWDGPKYNMWHRSAEIAYLLQNASTKGYPDLKTAQNNARVALLASAVINLKKSGGLSSSNFENLVKYAESDSDLLRRQIKIINPDIVVMGNIGEIVKRYIFDLGDPLDKDLRFYQYNQILFIDYWHPAYQIPAIMYYYTIAAKYSEYLRQIQ